MGEGQHHLVDGAGQHRRQRREIRRLRLGVELRGQHDRVVAPHRDAAAKPAAQLAQLRHRLVGRDHR
jgi:hypothetical protein